MRAFVQTYTPLNKTVYVVVLTKRFSSQTNKSRTKSVEVTRNVQFFSMTDLSDAAKQNIAWRDLIFNMFSNNEFGVTLLLEKAAIQLASMTVLPVAGWDVNYVCFGIKESQHVVVLNLKPGNDIIILCSHSRLSHNFSMSEMFSAVYIDYCTTGSSSDSSFTGECFNCLSLSGTHPFGVITVDSLNYYADFCEDVENFIGKEMPLPLSTFGQEFITIHSRLSDINEVFVVQALHAFTNVTMLKQNQNNAIDSYSFFIQQHLQNVLFNEFFLLLKSTFINRQSYPCKDQDCQSYPCKDQDCEATNVKTKIVKATHVKTKIVKATHVKTKIVKATHVKTKIVKATHVKTKIVKVTHVKTKIAKATLVKTKNVKATHVKTKIVKATHVKTKIVKATHVKTKIVKATHVKTKIVKATHVKTKIVKATHVKTKIAKATHVKTKIVKATHVKTKIVKATHVKTKTVKDTHVKTKIVKATHVKTKIVKATHVKTKIAKATHVKTKIVKATHVKTKIVKDTHVKTKIVKATHVKTKIVKATHVKTKIVKATLVKTKIAKATHIEPKKYGTPAARSVVIRSSLPVQVIYVMQPPCPQTKQLVGDVSYTYLMPDHLFYNEYYVGLPAFLGVNVSVMMVILKTAIESLALNGQHLR
ncbi:hypothetical protein Bpfe_000802, partial [Biomphalaria pfeifferi]